MRKLASIQEIVSISPIPGADSIELAQVLGWHVVVKKGQFVEKDPVVYVEVDSVLPEKPEFDFLRKYCFIDKNGNDIMSQRIPVLTDADLLRIVKRDFLACEHAEAISVLSGYSYDESLRVKIACLKIANGSLDELKHAVDNAMIDMRDIFKVIWK